MLIKCRPSGAEMWYHCPASAIVATLSSWAPSIYAATGTGVMQKIENAFDRLDFEVDDFDQYVGTTEIVDGLEVRYTQEDMDAAKECYEIVSAYEDGGGLLAVEEDMSMTVEVDGAKINTRGRLDFRIDFEDRRIIADYKHGAGKTVSALNNYQLLIYLKMAVEKFGPKKKYVLQIIQPRARETVQTVWEMTHKHFVDAWGHMEAAYVRVKKAADHFGKHGEIRYSDYSAGTNCQWCAIKGSCPKRVNRAVTAAVTGKAIDKWQEAPEEMIGWVLGASKEIKETISKAEKEALSRLQSGKKVFGFKLIKTAGKRSIRKDLSEEDIEKLKHFKLANDETKFAPLGDFDRLSKKIKDFDASHYIQPGKGGVKVVTNSTKGEEVDALVDVFGAKETEKTK